jgi:hypothetical protein
MASIHTKEGPWLLIFSLEVDRSMRRRINCGGFAGRWLVKPMASSRAGKDHGN